MEAVRSVEDVTISSILRAIINGGQNICYIQNLIRFYDHINSTEFYVQLLRHEICRLEVITFLSSKEILRSTISGCPYYYIFAYH
jgi:hypothetical protein